MGTAHSVSIPERCRFPAPYDLHETLRMDQTATVLAEGILGFNGTPIVAPNGVAISDSFQTRSWFLGPQFGVRGRKEWDRVSLDYAAKIAFGSTSNEVFARGNTSQMNAQGQIVNTTNGGLYALVTNSGSRTEAGSASSPKWS